jgi:diguanylate cyclase
MKRSFVCKMRKLLKESFLFTFLCSVHLNVNAQVSQELQGQDLETNLLLHGAFFGILLIVVIFNLIAFFMTKSWPFLSFVGLVLSFGVYQFAQLGFTGYFSSNSASDLLVVSSLAMSIICSYWFVDQVLELVKCSPSGRRLLQIFALAAGITALSFSVLAFTIVIKVFTVLVILISIVIVYLSVQPETKDSRVGLYCCITWTTLLCGTVLLCLNQYQLLPEYLVTEHLLSIGFLLMIVFLTVPFTADLRVLNRRYLEVEKERKVVEQEKHGAELKKMVKSRTTELENALTELSDAHETLKVLNTFDAVTGIKNRQFFNTIFDQEWKRAIREGYPISLLMLDIDHFKDVNDTYGHIVGDECLKSVATIIGNNLKRPADILARFGGEEFVVLLPYVKNKNAEVLAEQIRASIEQTVISVSNNNININIKLSIGLCTVTPTEKDDARNIIAAADIALYEAKDAGRNKVSNAGLLTINASGSIERTADLKVTE